MHRWRASRSAVFPAKRGSRSFSMTVPKYTHLNVLLILITPSIDKGYTIDRIGRYFRDDILILL